MTDNLAPVPVAAAKHSCGGPGCTFCEWSNPPLQLPELGQASDPFTPRRAEGGT